MPEAVSTKWWPASWPTKNSIRMGPRNFRKLGNSSGHELPGREWQSWNTRRGLQLAAHITNPPSRSGVGGEACDTVPPLPIRPPKIIDLRLCEVVAVGQRHTGNVLRALIDGFQPDGRVLFGRGRFRFRPELALERFEQIRRDRALLAHAVHFVPRFAQQACALASCPGPHPREPAVDDTERHQAVKRRIHPAIERDVGRPLISR